MRHWIKQKKWTLAWIPFGALLLITLFFAAAFEDKAWLPNVLQTMGITITVYASIALYLHSQEQSKRDTERQMLHMQQLFQQQIDALVESTQKQMDHLQELTEKQIDTLKTTTDEQINAFENQTNGMIRELADSSILLSEILGRQLEDAIANQEAIYNQAAGAFNQASNFKLLRTKQEREQQMQQHEARLTKLKQGYDYLMTKYNQLKNFKNRQLGR